MAETELHVPETMHIEPEIPDAPAATTTETFVSPRELAMRRIAERAEESRNRELEYNETMQDEARERAGVEEPEEAPEPAPVVAAPEPTPPPAPQPEPQGRVVSIQGEQYRVTDEQFAHLANIGALATAAMQQAPEQPAPQRQPQPPQQRQTLITDQEAQNVAHRLSYGDERDQAAAIRDLSNVIASRIAPQAPQMDQAAIGNAARAEAMRIFQERDLQQNLATLGNEYPDIFQDRTRSQLAALKLHELRGRDASLGVTKPDLDYYREACNVVRTALTGTASQPQPGPEQNQPSVQATPAADPQRLERKRAAPRQPSSASRVATAEAQPNRLPTASEIVENMRRIRGQIAMR